MKYDPDFVYLLENLTCAHSPCDVLCKNNHRIFCQREEFQSILDKPSNFRKNNLNCYGTYIITCVLKVLEVTICFVLNVQEFWTFSAKIDLLVWSSCIVNNNVLPYSIFYQKLVPCECTLTVSQIYSVFMPFLIFFFQYHLLN